MSISGDKFVAAFDGTATPAADGLAVRGKVKLEADDIEPWLMTVGAALPGMGLGTSVALAADADYGKGLLVLNGIDGTVAESAVSGDLNIALEAGIPKLSGALSLDSLDLFPLAEMIFGDKAVAQTGEAAWPVAPFSEGLTAPFAGDLTITAGTVLAGSLPPIHEANLGLQFDARDCVLIWTRNSPMAGSADWSNSRMRMGRAAWRQPVDRGGYRHAAAGIRCRRSRDRRAGGCDG
jgi:hypothetical protein